MRIRRSRPQASAKVESEVERFDPTGGRAIGVLGLVAAAVLVVLAVAARQGPWLSLVTGGILLAILVWSALLRPAVSVDSTTVVLRNMLETVHIPLPAVRTVVVRQMLVVHTADKRFVNPSVGRSLREVARGGARQRGSSSGGFSSSFGLWTPPVGTAPSRATSPRIDYPDYVTERIMYRVEESRRVHGVHRGSAEESRHADDAERRPAWPEIIGLGLAVVAFVFTLVR